MKNKKKGKINKRVCVWIKDDGHYLTTCNRMSTFADRGMGENKIEYCPYCGKWIIEKRGSDK